MFGENKMNKEFELSSTKFDWFVTYKKDGEEHSEIIKDIAENEIFKYLREHGYPDNADAAVLI